jgi:Protein of unknown function (DUF669)
MIFKNLTEEEINRINLLPEGVYDYQVIESKEKQSQKTGEDYISLTLKIYDYEGKEHILYNCNFWNMKIIKHFCDVNGLEEQYNSGNVPAEKCLYKSSGKVVIGIEGEKPDGNGGTYRPKNIVKDYIVAPPGSSCVPLTKNPISLDQDIPF